MPRGNGSGPMGMGPMTGRGAGYCAGYGAPGFMNAGPGYGRGRGGMGRGMAWGREWGRGGAPGPAAPVAYPQPTAEQELAALKQQADAMRRGLEDVQTRIDQLQKTPES